MRQTPYEIKAIGEGDSDRVDLFERLKKPANRNTAAVETETSTTAGDDKAEPGETSDKQPEGAPEEKKNPSATFDDTDDYDEFAKEVEGKLEDYIGDPQEFAEMLVGIIDVGRVVALPYVYESLSFPGNERNDIHHIVAKAAANEKENKPATEGFNNYEKRLYDKWPKVQKAIENLPYTEKNIALLSKIIARRMKGTTVQQWMVKYDWIIGFLFVEFTKARDIMGIKAKDFLHNKFG